MTEGAAESKALETVEMGPPVVIGLGSAPTPPPPPLLLLLELVVGFVGDPPPSTLLPELEGLGVARTGEMGEDVTTELEGGGRPLLLGVDGGSPPPSLLEPEGLGVATTGEIGKDVVIELEGGGRLLLLRVDGGSPPPSLPEPEGLGVATTGRGDAVMEFEGGERPLLLGIDSSRLLIGTVGEMLGLGTFELGPPMMLMLVKVGGAVGHDWTVGTVEYAPQPIVAPPEIVVGRSGTAMPPQLQ